MSVLSLAEEKEQENDGIVMCVFLCKMCVFMNELGANEATIRRVCLTILEQDSYKNATGRLSLSNTHMHSHEYDIRHRQQSLVVYCFLRRKREIFNL